jgi:hypothetical protein
VLITSWGVGETRRSGSSDCPSTAALFLRGAFSVCNLYSRHKGAPRQPAISPVPCVTINLPPPRPLCRAFVRTAQDGQRELTMACRGMPSPQFALKGRNSNPASRTSAPSPRRIGRLWLRVDSRYVVPFLAENESPARRLTAAGVVRARRKPPARLFRWNLDALNVGPQGQGRRDEQRTRTAISA